MGRRPYNQPDLFGGADSRNDLFGTAAPEPAVRQVDPDKIRRRLERILADARAAKQMPWDSAQQSLYQSIFPEMAALLPQDEAAQYCFQFEQEWVRLKAA